jgi:membrane protein implicated in regulation of membrane protease activity
MEPYLIWAVVGLVLIIVELLTGTFYLLVLGIACFGAAAVAFFGAAFPIQVILAAVVAGVGVYIVHAYRARNAARQMAPVDRGQPAQFERWVDRAGGLARVQYRGASWDAYVEGDSSIDPGTMIYVLSADGNTLKVSKTRPA